MAGWLGSAGRRMQRTMDWDAGTRIRVDSDSGEKGAGTGQHGGCQEQQGACVWSLGGDGASASIQLLPWVWDANHRDSDETPPPNIIIANSAGPLPGNSKRRHPSLQTPVRPGRAYNCQRRAVPGPQPGLGYPSPLRVPVRLRGTAHRRNHQPGSQGDSPGLRRRPTPCALRSVAAAGHPGAPRRASSGACALCEARRRDRRARGSGRRSRGVARERSRAHLSVIMMMQFHPATRRGFEFGS